jgi:hypothetical protein
MNVGRLFLLVEKVYATHHLMSLTIFRYMEVTYNLQIYGKKAIDGKIMAMNSLKYKIAKIIGYVYHQRMKNL